MSNVFYKLGQRQAIRRFLGNLSGLRAEQAATQYQLARDQAVRNLRTQLTEFTPERVKRLWQNPEELRARLTALLPELKHPGLGGLSPEVTDAYHALRQAERARKTTRGVVGGLGLGGSGFLGYQFGKPDEKPKKEPQKKQAGERVNVTHEGEDGYETYQRQATDYRGLRPIQADTNEIWDQFDKRIQNPAEAAFHTRFVSP